MTKSSTVCECRDILQEMRTEENCPIPTPDNCANYDRMVGIEKPKIMAEAKKKVEAIFRRKSSQAVGKLGFQGDMLKFLEEEERDISWKATIFKVPRGVMAWAVRAGTNTLATPDNLARWGRPVDTKCSMVTASAPLDTCSAPAASPWTGLSLDTILFYRIYSTPSIRTRRRR